MLARRAPKSSRSPLSIWFDRVIAALAVVNLGLVAFDLSYVPWRDWYLRHFPALTQWYGEQFKGIEPHRDTAAYLETVDRLKEQVTQTGIESNEVNPLLTDLRSQSNKMIDENPFELAGKSGRLERIKNEMRDRINNDSSKQAFAQFWSQDYLSQQGWNQEIAFFDAEIRPLIATNYFRNIDETGGFIDRFWRIDIWFTAIFAAELLARTFYISRRYRGMRWLDAVLWRWYDLFLILPFWRWLRVIPVVLRLNQAKLINLESIRTRMSHSLVANFAVELTEIVVLRIIDQTQNLIRSGTVTQMLLKPENRQRYIELSGVDEVEAIANRLISVLVYRVLPQIKPDVEAIIQHSLSGVLQQLPAYNGLQMIPGVTTLSKQLTDRIASEASGAAYHALVESLKDTTGAELTRRLIEQLIATFRAEVQEEQTLEEIESLLTIFLEEVKVNYVKNLAQEDIDKLREETQQIYQITQGNQ